MELDQLNIEFLRNYIGVVSQEPMLFNTTIEQVSSLKEASYSPDDHLTYSEYPLRSGERHRCRDHSRPSESERLQLYPVVP